MLVAILLRSHFGIVKCLLVPFTWSVLLQAFDHVRNLGRKFEKSEGL